MVGFLKKKLYSKTVKPDMIHRPQFNTTTQQIRHLMDTIDTQ